MPLLPVMDLEIAIRALPPLPTPDEEKGLREAICDFVDAGRKQGAGPEHLIVALRGAARRANPRLVPSVLDRAITYCIEQYYASETDAGA